MLTNPNVREPIQPLPKTPPPGLLESMAIRSDHGLGVPGHYDQPMFSENGMTHEKRLKAELTNMSQLYEEVSGHGFYQYTENPHPSQPEIPEELKDKTFRLEYTPNCANPFLIRILGKGQGKLDGKPYIYPKDDPRNSKDIIGFGTTLKAATNAAMGKLQKQ